MPNRDRARTAPRGTRSTTILVVIVVVGTALVGVLLYEALTPSSSAPPRMSAPQRLAPPGAAPPGGVPRGDRRDTSETADGGVPAGATVFDDDLPAVANLQPDLRSAVRDAATAAARDGVGFVVNSGWRSPAYQARLLREAVEEYGSEAEAARWVATPETSPHVSGAAIDVGPVAAATWLSRHGADYGLCQIYGNEPWHFELRPTAVGGDCPPMYADPTADPRMRR